MRRGSGIAVNVAIPYEWAERLRPLVKRAMQEEKSG